MIVAHKYTYIDCFGSHAKAPEIHPLKLLLIQTNPLEIANRVLSANTQEHLGFQISTDDIVSGRSNRELIYAHWLPILNATIYGLILRL
jgi:hypothetical protein